MGDHQGTIKIEYDIRMKTKLKLTHFDGSFGTLNFDEKWRLKTFLGFKPFWDYKPTNAIHGDSPGFYTSGRILNLSTTNKIHLKADDVDGSIVDGSR